MSYNLGKKDRMIRFSVSSLIIVVGIFIHCWWAFIGIEPLLTVVFSFSPIYAFFGLNTYKTN